MKTTVIRLDGHVYVPDPTADTPAPVHVAFPRTILFDTTTPTSAPT